MPSEYQCPLCQSQLSREVYERVLKIREARDKEFNKELGDLHARVKAAEAKREESIREAAETARKKAEAAAKETLAPLQRQLQHLRADAAAAQQRFRSEVVAAERRARQAAERGAAANLKKKEADHRAAIVSANRKLEALTRQLVLQRKEEKRNVEQRERAAQQVEKERAQRQIDALKNELKVMEERRKREATDWKRITDDLKLKADRHDRGHFGPEGEEQLVAVLKSEFPGDIIEHRGKGGDVVHTVVVGGKEVDKVIYECKRTAKWSKSFTRQLKEAMAKHDTRHGLLVSRCLPQRASGFVVNNGVLAVEPHLAASLAGILRKAIVELAHARLSEDGKAAKTAELYEYLRSDDFGNAIRRVKDKVQELRGSLETEKSSHERWWNTREQHYATMLREVTGIDGRVTDILGAVRSGGLRRTGT